MVQHAIDHHEDESMLHTIAKALACGNEVARNAPKAIKSAALKIIDVNMYTRSHYCGYIFYLSFDGVVNYART